MESERLIPKKIHYCWFGNNKLSAKAQKCIKSWKKFCPDYEIIEWNESNFDIHINEYTEWCHKENKYAFLSDYARLIIIYNNGGIYLDVDVELLKPLDPLLGNSAYFGFETDRFINTGLGFGAEKGSRTVSELIKMYDSLLDGKHGTVGCPILNTRGIEACGFKADGSYQKIGNVSVYPADYFNPYEDATGRLKITENTYSIHWFAKSWMSRKSLIRSTLSKPVHRIFGTGFLKGKKK